MFFYASPDIVELRKKLFGIIGIKLRPDIITDEINEIDRIIEKDNLISSQLYTMWNYYIDNPEHKGLEDIAKEIQKNINLNLNSIVNLMYNHEKNLIKKLIKSGRIKLASMGEIERKFQLLQKTEDLISDEFDYTEHIFSPFLTRKIMRLNKEFDQIHVLKNDAELLVKDATMPAILKYLGTIAAVVIAIIALYLNFVK